MSTLSNVGRDSGLEKCERQIESISWDGAAILCVPRQPWRGVDLHTVGRLPCHGCVWRSRERLILRPFDLVKRLHIFQSDIQTENQWTWWFITYNSILTYDSIYFPDLAAWSFAFFFPHTSRRFIYAELACQTASEMASELASVENAGKI